MKRMFTLLLGLALLLPLGAQENYSKEEFLRRYTNLTGRVGVDGVGVETLLNKWEAAWPDDVNQLLARFHFCFTRSQQPKIVQMDRDRYLGNAPLLPMTDSLGNKLNYFEVYEYDDELFAAANSAISRAISTRENRLDWRLLQVNALIAYEKEEPVMALQQLKELVDYQYQRKPDWEHEQLGSVTREQFKALMQDYCVVFFRIASDASNEAFRSLSEQMLLYEKGDPLFSDNLGSYYLVKKDYKKARKCFDQVLKKHPGDMTALKNCILMARSSKDVKMEKKYLALMAKNGESETDRAAAQARLDAYNKK